MKPRRKITIKKFRFKLEPLLRLRKVEENLAMANLARVMRKVNIEEEHKQRALHAIDQELAQFNEKNETDTKVGMYTLYSNYIDRLESEIKDAENRLHTIQPELEQEQAKVITARKQKRIVELMKDRAKARYNEELRKTERKQLQELNIMKASQKQQDQEETHENKYKGLESKYKQAEIDAEIESEAANEQPEEKPDPVKEYMEKHGFT